MASRTYLPTLIKILRTMCVYIARYRDQILKVIGDGNADVLDGLVTACNVFMAVADVFIPDGV